MDEYTKQHVEQVHQWLEDNVKTYPTPKQVTLHSFQVDWTTLSGSFRLTLDDNELSEKLTFGIDQSGKVIFELPIFCSPLGAPASYPAVELTERTSNAVLSGLRKVIPRVMGCGMNRETGKEILFHTPIQYRILNKEEFEMSRELASLPDYLITVEISHTQTAVDINM